MALLLSTSALNRLRRTYDGALQDECILLSRTASGGTYGYSQAVYATGETVACLYRPSRVGESLGRAQVFGERGFCYIPRGTVVDNVARIKITKIRGVPVDPVTYEISEGPTDDQVGLRLSLQLVTDGSDV